MTSPVDQLVELLDLEQIEVNIFRGRSPEDSRQRVFGGQVAGQALVAAARTVDPERPVHSLHAYFLRPGSPEIPIVYQVEQVRDGWSFSTRRVVAVQNGKTIFNLTASFQRAEEGVDQQLTMPTVPRPEELSPLVEELQARLPEIPKALSVGQPFDIRPIEPIRWTSEDLTQGDPRSMTWWLRTDGSLADDPLLHTCAATYASDLMLLNVVRLPLEPIWGPGGFDMASLDHALWFHRPFRADEWLLYQQELVSTAGARGLARGQLFDLSGRHVMSVMQEGLFRRVRQRGDGDA